MTEEELIKLLSGRFYENFADKTAAVVCGADAVGLLYATVTGPSETMPRVVRHKVLFRGAYVLERIYFDRPELFRPYAERFCRRDFAACADPSARRHFTKIMADLLGRYTPEQAAWERIAEAAADWAADQRMRTAVRIWSVEVLRHCRERVGWVAESWADILALMSENATPGIACRLRKSWNKTR